MIILGDIAAPSEASGKLIADFFADHTELFSDQSVLFNLEGLISDHQDANNNSPILFNHSAVLKSFDGYVEKVAALANNHTLDLPHLLQSTKQMLAERGFKSVGAGNTRDADFQVTEIREDNHRVLIINACWDFLLYHQNNKNSEVRVNVIDEFAILRFVRKVRAEDPDCRILTYFHWSFDLEIIPSPSYRVFAKDLIDAGVSLVVGGHSHCVQGGEKYKNGYIVYGLGNFYLPSGIYANGKLSFPSMSDLGWALKWKVGTNELENIWVDSSSNQLKLVTADAFEHSEELRKYSGYAGLTDQEYVVYFKTHRRKRKITPTFYNYEQSLSNRIKMRLLKSRARIARLAAKLNLIGWQN